jgi:transcriptional regulator with XRE-family HTH domain
MQQLTASPRSDSVQSVSDWQERLSEAMEARGISGGELARRTGFTAQYMNSLRSKERGARLPLDTARKLAHALGISVEWLTAGTGTRDRLSDVYPVYTPGAPDSAPLTDRYPTRGEAIALLATTVEPEVIVALRAVVPPNADADPGRDFWIERAKGLARDLRRIKADPGLRGEAPPPTRRSKRAK